MHGPAVVVAVLNRVVVAQANVAAAAAVEPLVAFLGCLVEEEAAMVLEVVEGAELRSAVEAVHCTSAPAVTKVIIIGGASPRRMAK